MLLHVQGQVLVAGASNLQATAEDCCQACWMYGGQPHNFTDAKMGECAHPLWRAYSSLTSCIHPTLIPWAMGKQE